MYESAFTEIREGRKKTHWMWFIFPQLLGLGRSETSIFFAIKSRSEAIAYLGHPLLGKRLVEMSQLVLSVNGKTATDIFDSPEDMKLRSCMTLFSGLPGASPVFRQVLEKYFDGEADSGTLQLLAAADD